MMLLLRISYISLCLIAIVSCNSNNLGNNFWVMEGDNNMDRVIVFCNSENFGSCNSGTFVVPSYEDHIVNGKYNEYVTLFKSNSDWVIAKTAKINDQSERYWIINKKEAAKILPCDNCQAKFKAFVVGPLTQTEFIENCELLSINLKF